MSAGSRLIRGAGELLRIPTIDIAEVGAGGGSIAWLDPAGGLQVGPRSAGADPGPACYGRGGVEPTVTDANVVLGYMPAVTVADGQISISAELAEEAVRRVAEPLGLTLLEAAERDPPDRERADDARAALGLVREGPRPARLRARSPTAARGRSTPPGWPRISGSRTVRRAGGRRALQRRRPPVRAARVPRGADLPPRRRRGRSRVRRRALRRDASAELAAALAGAPRPSGRGRRTSATAARAGRSRSRCPAGRDRHRRSLAALRARFEDEHERLYGVEDSRARRSRSGRCGSPRSAVAPTRSFQLDGAAGATGRPTRTDLRRRRRRRGAGARRGRRSATRRSPGRCSSTSTTPRSSSRPAGRSAGTSRPGRSCPGADGGTTSTDASIRSRSRSSRNALASIADEMATTIFRTAHSTVVRDGMDFSAAVCDASGETVAQAVSVPFHLGSIPAAMETLLEHYGERDRARRRVRHERPVRRRHAPAGHLRLQARPPRGRADRLHAAPPPTTATSAGGCPARAPATTRRSSRRGSGCPGSGSTPRASRSRTSSRSSRRTSGSRG